MKNTEIIQRLKGFENEGKKMFITSSFQSHSIPLLHIISEARINIDVLFINTGFHFPETLTFRDQVSDLLKLNVIDVRSLIPKILQRDNDKNFYFVSDPDYCCYLNKVQVLEPYLDTYDIWVNGVRSEQNKNRSQLKEIESTPRKAIRYHPILSWTSKMIYEYQKEYSLPKHPLEEKGYLSIGCEPCTRKFDLNDERSARWYGMNKTECGIHVDLVKR